MRVRKRGYVGVSSPDIAEREIRNAALARRAAAEGFVLLKNEAHFLPLEKGCLLGLYGAGAVKTVKGGTGSGDVNNRANINIFQGLKNGGFRITEASAAWLDDYESCYRQAREAWREEILGKIAETCDGNFFDAYSTTPFSIPVGAPIDTDAARSDGAETAVYVLSRIAGENADRHDVPGDYYISAEEQEQISQICAAYRKVILVINTGGLMDLAFTDSYPNIVSIIQYVQAGQEGGNALADILSGAVTPSGKMTDTWALDYRNYPNADYFSFKSGNVFREEYREGIYVGYRYFDTFDLPVRYCFGHGLSYTDFSITTETISADGLKTASPTITLTVQVRNTGKQYSGREVVQIYVSCPQGNLPKEYRRLAAFAKTRLLAPGETQTLEISFPLYFLASYYETTAAWILEGGKIRHLDRKLPGKCSADRYTDSESGDPHGSVQKYLSFTGTLKRTHPQRGKGHGP